MKKDEWLLIYLSLPAKISSDLNDPIRIKNLTENKS